MTAAGAVRLVATREIITRARARSYLVTTVIMVIAVVALSLVISLVGGGGKHSTVGVTDRSLAAPLHATGQALGQQITVRVVDRATGERKLRSGGLDALLTAPDQVEVKKKLASGLKNPLTVLVRQIALDRQIGRLGGDPRQVDRAVAATKVHVRPLEHTSAYRTERIVVGIVTGALVYLALVMYGQFVAQGVIEEKSSRIVELLLTSIQPWQLMLGKVLGIGVVGLAQFVVVGGVGMAASLGSGALHMPASVLTWAAVWGLVWFLLGFLIYALLAAAAGALVSRQEEAGSVIAPVMMLIIIPYVLGISILPGSPDNGLLHVLSLIPLFAPTLMPMRIAIGGVPAWEFALSIGPAVATIVAFVWLAGRVYRGAVLRTGTRVRLKDAFRAA